VSYVFLLLFVAAVVGIFKPYINGAKRWHFAVGAVASFFLVGVFAPSGPANDKQSAAVKTEALEDAAPKSATNNASQPEVTSKWEYSESRDEMRGTTAKFASVTSENVVNLEFPYGEVKGQIWIRRRPEDGLNLAFEVDKGQVLCHSYSDDFISMKFDNGPIQKFRCTGSSDGSSETAFVLDEQRALAALKRAKRTVVEAEFFQQGRQQFVFETAGLKWQ
jgi:hypothetical protein